MNGVGWHADDLGRLCNDGVDLAIDPDTPVAASLARLFRKPVVPVPPPQHLHDGDLELLELSITAGVLASDQVNQKVGR